MAILLLLLTCVCADAFYIPLLGPTNFCEAPVKETHGSSNCLSEVYVHVNKLDSVETLIPYDYYSFDFCEPGENSTDRDPVENLGQVLDGDRLRSAGYKIEFHKSMMESQLLCYRKINEGKAEFLYNRIHENYMQQWVIDNIPVTWCYSIVENQQPYCTTHFPVGCYVTPEGVQHDACYMLSNQFTENDTTYIINHVHFLLSYHEGTAKNDFTDGHLVRARVQLASCNSFPCTEKSKPMKIPKPGKIGEELQIPYSYSVEFNQKDDIRWAARWDYILSSVPQSKLQWFGLAVSILSTIFISSMSVVFARRHYRATLRDKQAGSQGGLDYCGWKSVRGDVFRPPTAIMLLSTSVGAGSQISLVTLLTVVFACMGLLSPPNRGALTTAILVFYVLLGSVAGYVSARLYKMMGGLRWKSNVLLTSLLVPGIVFGVFFFLNLLLWGAKSSAAVPVTTLLALLCLWFGISLPLTFLGYFVGIGCMTSPSPDSKAAEEPVIAKDIPRRIPCLCRPVIFVFIGGILPFACIQNQLSILISSIWYGQMYYTFGFVLLTFLLFLVICAEISIIVCHYYLCYEDHRWWWRAFFSTGSTSLYLFLYIMYYLIRKTALTGALSYILYFGYTFIAVFLFFLMAGTIGFLSSLLFVTKLYATIPDQN